MGLLQLDALPLDVLGALAVLVTVAGAYLRREYKRRSDQSDADTDEPSETLPEPPFEFTRADAAPSRVVIAASNQLRDKHGDAPAHTVARQIHAALSEYEIPHQVLVDNSEIDPPAEGTVGSGTPAWWRDSGAAHLQTYGNANLLLVDQVGGGGTYGPWAVVGAGGIGVDLAAVQSLSGPDADCLSAALHELLHIYGVSHDFDDEANGKQHTGLGWNHRETETWHRTPACVDNDVINACGEAVPARRYDDTVQELMYSQCTVDHMDPLNHPCPQN